MRCPKGFKQHPPKSGICVPKTAKKMSVKKVSSKSPKKIKRCPKGTRKNKLGVCVPKIEKFQSKKLNILEKMSTPLDSSSMSVEQYDRLRNNDPVYRNISNILIKVLQDDIDENELNYAKKNFNEFKAKNIKLIHESVITIKTDPEFDKDDIEAYLEKNGLLDELYKFDKQIISK